MPRDGSILLSDLLARGNTRLEVTCTRCPRAGKYAIASLIKKHGDLALVRFLEEASATCPRRTSPSGDVYDRCGAVFVGL